MASKENLMRWSLGMASRMGKFIVIIPRGTPLPAKRSAVVTTVKDSQKSIELDIRLGEGEKAEDNYPLSSIRLTDIEPAAKGVARVRLTFYAYANSIFEIGVRYKEDGPEQKLSIIPSSGMSEEQIARIQKMVAKYAEECKPQELETLAGAVIPLPETAQQDSILPF